jgi:hypothetical protein
MMTPQEEKKNIKNKENCVLQFRLKYQTPLVATSESEEFAHPFEFQIDRKGGECYCGARYCKRE